MGLQSAGQVKPSLLLPVAIQQPTFNSSESYPPRSLVAEQQANAKSTGILPLSLFTCRRRYACHKFDSIYRKNMQQLYLQINLLKN